MSKGHIKILLFFLITLTIGSYVNGQQVLEIPVDQIVVDGGAMGIMPGDTLLLEGGIRDAIRFENLTGSEDQPIIIMNNEDRVIVETEAHTGILFLNSSFTHLTGSGGSDFYGIEIASAASMGVMVTGFSTNCEIDHLEIHQIGFAGIMAKTDPNCSRPDVSEFIMRNLSFHDNYIYDTGGEGFYIGYSWYPTREVDCDGSTVTLYPHSIQGLRVYDNRIRDTGWDGLQVGSATSDVRIYGNTIENFGLEEIEFQTSGVQLGSGTTGDFYNNFIYNGKGGGISFFGSGNNRLFNNVIMQTAGNAIYHNDRGASPGTTYKIYNNTIIHPLKGGIEISTTITRNNLIANNLIVLGGAIYGITGAGLTWTNEGNQVYGTMEEVGFQHPDTLNFRLTEGSKALDAGYAISFLNFDYDFYERPANGKHDVGAFEYGSVPYVPPVLAIPEQKATGIIIFPNPTLEQLNIRTTEKYQPDAVMIYDHFGKLVLNRKLKFDENQTSQLRLNDRLAEGIYSVHLFEDGQQISVKKLVME